MVGHAGLDLQSGVVDGKALAQLDAGAAKQGIVQLAARAHRDGR